MANPQLTAQRIRFACDASKPFAAAVDANTGAAIVLPSGSALQLENIFYFGAGAAIGDTNLLDLTVYSSIVVQLQDNADPHSGTVFYNGSLAAANFATPSTANWIAGTGQHTLLVIPSAQNIVPPAVTNYWICIYGVLAAGGSYVLLSATNITGKDSGVPVAGATLPINLKLGGKLPFICSSANGGDNLTRDLFLQPGPNAGQWITAINQVGYNGPGQALYSFYCDPANGGDGLFRDVFLQASPVPGGVTYVLALNQNGHS